MGARDMSWKKIELRKNEFLQADGSVRQAEQIELWGYDMVFRKNICSKRDVYLAHRMAEELDVPIWDCRDRHANPVVSVVDDAMYRYEATSELHTNWEDCAADMYRILKGQ